jgi:beta-glucosidase
LLALPAGEEEMIAKCFLAAALTIAPLSAQQMLYKNPQAPLEKRVDDLVSRMTLEEKVSQLMNDSPAIDRLGIPAYNWWNESLHGVARAGRATVFPQAIGLAATWDTNVMSRVATAISDEARAKYHEFVRRGKHNIYQGLTFWTPNINLFRDPRWGRGMETYGEDPYLTGRMAIAFIKAMQGDDPKYLKTIATAKHYAVHSGPEPLRHTFDAVVSERDLRETYLPHFEAAVREGGAQSVMCAYNSVDGQPACANTQLLGEILRKEWGFQGYVVSDCGAIGDIYKNHKFVPTAEEGVSRAIKAGTDLNCGTEYSNVLSAVHKGLLTETEVNQSLRRLLVARFKLGMFDPPEMVKYAQIPYSENDSPAHRQLAIEAARKSIVLLKNDNHTLPLSKTLKTIAVIGPNADDTEVLVANYNGIPSAPVTPLAGIREKLGGTRVLYARGSDLAENLPHMEVIPSSALFTTMAPGRENGLIGEYYNSANFDGRLHRPRELTYPSSGQSVGRIPANLKPRFTRIDREVNFNWWDGAPRKDMNDDDFGIRWTGYLSAPVTGTYQLGAEAMNAFELYFEDKLLVRSTSVHGGDLRYAPVNLEAGKLYKLHLDFHEFVNEASVRLLWAKPATGREEEEALAAARQADAVILFLGLSARLEGEEMQVKIEGFEGGDRVQIGLPHVQEELLTKVAALGKPTVLVLLNGSALAVNWARDHIPAIVEAWYPGQAAGIAVADVLFGDYNPAGRLPVTFYRSIDQLPPFTDYSMKGRTYRFFTGEPLFPFGYGLSYTTFSYRNLTMPTKVDTGQSANVSVEVENTGKMAGEEVVQLYTSTGAKDGPIRSLAGFERISLRPGERRTVNFRLGPRELSSVANDGRRAVRPGSLQIAVGGRQPAPNATGVLTGAIRIEGQPKPVD